MNDPDQPVTTNQAKPFDILLAQCRDLAGENLSQALTGMLDKADETLSSLMNDIPDRDARAPFSQARDVVLKQRAAFEEQFHTQYLREFQVRSNRMKKIGQRFSDLDSSALELDLVGEDDLNETLKFNDMASRLRRYCDEELIALDQRVGVLLGDANLGAEDNPFSPQAICDAYKHTCRGIEPSVAVRMILLRLFDDHVIDDIRSVYKAVNALLVKNSILPTIRFAASRNPKDKLAAAGGQEDDEAVETPARPAEKAAGGEQDFFALMQKMLAANQTTGMPFAQGGGGAIAMPGIPLLPGTPGMAGGNAGQVVVLQGADLMGLLTRVQQSGGKVATDDGTAEAVTVDVSGTTNVLRDLKTTSVGAGMNQMDTMTLDIVAMLFDQLFDDPQIPIAVKGLIGRMQISILKVAIADKDFFSLKTHPARRMLDTLGEISLRLPSTFSVAHPLFGRLETLIQDLLQGFQDNIEIFDQVRERLQSLVQEEDQRVAQETRPVEEKIEQKESLAVSKTIAQTEVKARIQSRDILRPVREFLVLEWVKVLMMVHIKRGPDSELWKNTLSTMDQLIWSVKPNHTPDDRRELAKKVPVLLARMVAGLKIAGVESAIHERFFALLYKIHARALNQGTPDSPPDLSDSSTENPAATTTVVVAPEAAAPKSVPAARPVETAEGTAGKPVGTPATAARSDPAAAPPAARTAAESKPVMASTGQPVKASTGQPVKASSAQPIKTTKSEPAKATTSQAPTPAVPESDSLDFTAIITIKNPFGEGKVQVEDLDFSDSKKTSASQPAVSAKELDFINNIMVGTWVEFRQQDEQAQNRPAKLSYVSSHRSKFLFVDRVGEVVKECSRAELAMQLRLGKIALMDDIPLVDRIMKGLVGKMR